MAFTSDNVTSLARSLINEATAKFWEDTEITIYIMAAMSQVLGEFFPFLYEEMKASADIGVVMSTPTVAVPANCYKPGELLRKSTGQKLRPISTHELWKYADLVDSEPIAWTRTGSTITLFPTPADTDSDNLTLWYMPILDAVTEFPDVYRPLIAVVAAKLALLKDDNMTPSIVSLERNFRDAVMMYSSLNQFGEGDMIGSSAAEDGYV